MWFWTSDFSSKGSEWQVAFLNVILTHTGPVVKMNDLND